MQYDSHMDIMTLARVAEDRRRWAAQAARSDDRAFWLQQARHAEKLLRRNV